MIFCHLFKQIDHYLCLNVCSLTNLSSSTDREVFHRLLIICMQYLHIRILHISPPKYFCFAFFFLHCFDYSLLFVVFNAGLKAYPALLCSAALGELVCLFRRKCHTSDLWMKCLMRWISFQVSFPMMYCEMLCLNGMYIREQK